jgi:transposase-like protein
MHLEVRRQGAVRSTAVLLAVGIGEDGQREILGLEMALSETGPAWERLIDQLKERGLSGVEVATSDAHEGLKQALREAFPGLIWQRCQAHFKRNVMDQTPASYKDRMDQVLDQILRASSQQEAQDRFKNLREELAEEAPSALEVLEGGLHEATAGLALPGKYRRRLRTTNMIERFIQEVRRREKPIRIFSSVESARRLVRALCAETHEEWSTGRCYFDMEEFFEWKASRLEDYSSEEDSFGDQASSTENSVDRDEAVAA